MAIVNLGTKEAYDLVDLQAMKKYLIAVKNNFERVNQDGSIFGYLSQSDFSKIDGDDPSRYIGTIPGCMAIHENGEMDIRGVYCSLVVADILGIMCPEISDKVGDFLISC